MSSQVHYAYFSSRNTVAQDTVEFHFQLDADLHFRPGQFVSVEVGKDLQNNPILRSYSIGSKASPTRDLCLILRMVGEGQGTRFFNHLNKRDPLRFVGPMGFFVNELFHPGDVVYASTGTGIAPIYPMIQETLLREEGGRVFLFWSVRTEEDLFFQAELASLQHQFSKLVVHQFVSRPKESYTGPKGRIIAPILQTLPTLIHPTFYLCGNGQMIEELKGSLVNLGIHRKRQIRTEAFFD